MSLGSEQGSEWRPVSAAFPALLSRGGASSEDIDAAEVSLSVPLPSELREFVQRADAAEGFVGDSYLAMWPIASIADLNTKARVAQYAPDLILFATDGGGEGYGFERQGGAIVNVPMIGMGRVARTPAGDSFNGFLRWLVEQSPVEGHQPQPNRQRLGLVIVEKTPIIVGGSPTDPRNKVLIPLAQYAEVVGWWNEHLPPDGVFPLPGPGTNAVEG